MKCPKCVEENKTSRLYPGSSVSTLMAWQPYYDEDGKYHSHDPNERTIGYSCSNGHNGVFNTKVMCPAEGCEYGQNADIAYNKLA